MILQNYSHNNSTPTVPNDEFYDPKPEEIDINNLQIPILKHGGEEIIEKIKAKEKQLIEKITEGKASTDIISLKAELNKLQTVNKELLEDQIHLTNLRIQYIKRWDIFSDWFNGSHGKTNRHSYVSLNGKNYYSKNHPLTISNKGSISISNITLMPTNESNFHIQLLTKNLTLNYLHYSSSYQGYKLKFPNSIEVDFIIYLVNSTWLSELKIMMQLIIDISDSIREQKEKIATYIKEQQSQTKDFGEYTVDLKNLDY